MLRLTHRFANCRLILTHWLTSQTLNLTMEQCAMPSCLMPEVIFRVILVVKPKPCIERLTLYGNISRSYEASPAIWIGITQCYLPPSTGERFLPQQTGRRYHLPADSPEGRKAALTVVVGCIPRYFTCPQTGWWRGVVGNAFRLKRSYSTPGLVSTAMGDCLWAGKPSQCEACQLG